MTFLFRVLVVTVVLVASGCSVLIPSERELAYSSRRLAEVPGVVASRVWCNDDIGATSELCGSVRMTDGVEILFFGVGYRSFGEAADQVLVANVGGLKPFVGWCGEQGAFSGGRPIPSEVFSGTANFQQDGRFGSHLDPPLTDIVDGVRRHRDLQSALQKWPRCPDYWSFREAHLGVRYCVFDDKSPGNRPPSDPLCAG